MKTLQEVKNEIKLLKALEKEMENKIVSYGYIDYVHNKEMLVPICLENHQELTRFSGRKVKVTVEALPW